MDVGRAGKTTGEEGGCQGIEVDVAGEGDIQGLDPSRSGKQEGGCVASAGRRRDPCPQDVGLRVFHGIERAGLRARQQTQGLVERTRSLPVPCRRQRATPPAPGIDGQHRRAFKEGRRRREASARPRALRRELQHRRDLLVRSHGGLCQMPGATIGVDLRICRFGEREVNAPSCLDVRRLVHRRADQRMPEDDARTEGQDAFSR